MDILDDPRVEWELVEQDTAWPFRWAIAVNGAKRSGEELYVSQAMDNLRRFARIQLNGARIAGRTNPCVICDKPSRVGMATDTDECQRLLDKARAELP